MLPELGGDLDDELFGNSDSGNQPSTSNPTSVQAQTDGTQEVQRDLNNQKLKLKTRLERQMGSSCLHLISRLITSCLLRIKCPTTQLLITICTVTIVRMGLRACTQYIR